MASEGGEIMNLFNMLKQALSARRKHEGAEETQNKNDEGSNGEEAIYGEKQNMKEEDKKKRVSILTPREYELYLLLIEGFTLKESAEKLSIKYSTANTHMTGVYKKLGVNSRAELIINYRYINETYKKGP